MSSPPQRTRERVGGPWSLLSLSGVYNGFQQALAISNSRGVIADVHIRASPGDRVLDIGCGPAEILRFLPPVDYVGVDLNARYLAAARRRYPAAQFLERDVRTLPGEWRGRFDLVLAHGLLHHFNDEDVLGLLDAARTFLKAGGRLITVDPGLSPEQSRVARLLAKLDRGRFVRTAERYRHLARRVFPEVDLAVYEHLMRIPYTHVIMECTNL